MLKPLGLVVAMAMMVHIVGCDSARKREDFQSKIVQANAVMRQQTPSEPVYTPAVHSTIKELPGEEYAPVEKTSPVNTEEKVQQKKPQTQQPGTAPKTLQPIDYKGNRTKQAVSDGQQCTRNADGSLSCGDSGRRIFRFRRWRR